MNVAKVVAVLGVLVMASVLVYGFTVGDFGAEGQALLSLPWGIVSLVDVYVGFVLFSGWIFYEEFSVVFAGRSHLADSVIPPIVFLIVNPLLSFD